MKLRNKGGKKAAPTFLWPFLLLVASPFLLLSAISGLGNLIDDLRVSFAKEECIENGAFIPHKAAQADGYFLARSIDTDTSLGVDEIYKELLDKRFSYFETDQGYNPQLEAVGNGKYHRFYLAKRDSESCTGYNKNIASYPLRVPFLRKLGLPVDMCIAAIRTDELKSNYEKRLIRKQGIELLNGYAWSFNYVYIDRRNSQLIAEVTRNGYYPGKIGHGYVCQNDDQLQLFEKWIEAIPDPRLPPKNSIEIVDNPPPFKQEIDLHAHLLADESVNRYLSEDEVAEATNPIGPNGLISFEGRYRAGPTLSGYYLVVIRPGTTRKVLIKAFGSGYSDFRKITILDNQEIVFFGYRDGTERKDNDIAVFRFSPRGEPLSAYRIRLPEIQLRGNFLFLVKHILIHSDSLEITLIDAAGERYGARAVREYSLRASFELEQ